GANAGAAPVRYTLAVFDGCGNKSAPVQDSTEHRTIYLTASIQSCLQQVALNWTPYIHWTPSNDVSVYRVETSVDNAPYSLAQSLPDGTFSYNYSLSGVAGDSICIRISAVHPNGITTSESNEVCLPIDIIRSTAFNYLRSVSVNPAGGVDVEWYIDSSANINTYFIRRSLDGNLFTTVATLPITIPVLLNNYHDAEASTSLASFYYRVNSLDDCNYQDSSGTGRTILLTGTNTGTINTLAWNAFELDYATVVDYTLYRVQSGSLVPVQTVPSSTLFFNDSIADVASSNGAFCYVVEASYVLDIPGFITETLTSRSNEACVYQVPVMYVPKAFVPFGKNSSFKPALLNPNVTEYEFKVFDRWGKQLFETNQLNIGWDGTHNGELLPLGGYAYYIKVVSLGGAVLEKKGMVVLVR
ncbi:MAG TPA: gliding motility-associated C-terminal domain-containing protein, partial [Chitinophagales bacterium]|nr:gliding motility-associated C-terminal domain-containing protein [Chitinophagales bacterium]